MIIAALIKITGAAVAALFAVPASAISLTVNNPSFETLPAGGLPFTGCGAGCNYSDDSIPGWTVSNAGIGQFQPGPASGNFTYFNYVPDGLTLAYSNGGTIVQTLSDLAVAGTTYTLSVDLGFRKDFVNPGGATLVIGSNAIVATGNGVQFSGDWFTYTASYTATLADNGSSIAIVLGTQGAQLDAENVRVSAATVPEPTTWALLFVGFGMVGVAARRRRTTVAA